MVKDNSLLQCQKGVRTMGMPIHLHPFGTEQALCEITAFGFFPGTRKDQNLTRLRTPKDYKSRHYQWIHCPRRHEMIWLYCKHTYKTSLCVVVSSCGTIWIGQNIYNNFIIRTLVITLTQTCIAVIASQRYVTWIPCKLVIPSRFISWKSPFLILTGSGFY